MEFPRYSTKASVLSDGIRKVFEAKQPFHCSVRFPKIPLMYVEASFESYLDNPFYADADVMPDPCGIMLMDTSFSYWAHEGSIPIVSDTRAIEKIEEDTVNHLPEFKKRLQNIRDSSNEDLGTPDKIMSALDEVNRVSVDIYRRFGLFIDESLQTADLSKIQKLQEVRMMLDDVVVHFLFKAYDRIISILIEHFDLDEELVKNATARELSGIIHGQESNVDHIKYRPIAFVLFQKRVMVVFDEEAREIEAFLSEQDPDKKLAVHVQNKNEFRGLSGHPGRVVGNVRKILAPDYHDKQKLTSLLTGGAFILVAPMTAPELVPYFRHAKGFITDEGGITCHAAIVAREMGIPCITGTRIATQVLQDADLVELNADEGTVKILNKSLPV